MLEEDGVSRGESENAAISETGERVYSKFLVRGEYWVEIDFSDLTDRVPRRTIRQVANRLRPPFDRYIKPTW